MSAIAIRADKLGKQYNLGIRQAGYRTFREAILNSLAAPVRWMQGEQKNIKAFWALDDISFEINHGEAVGIIGRNGAGKSTLLKILSRITKPTKGRVDLYGRVASLLEVGTGFHPELSGRDNIYLNGAILGMSRREIDRKFDEIVDFADVEKFLDTPVKHYSSGMYVRLAFAVAAHLEPEILVVDEVLAVGDAEFQKKCLGKMGDVAKQGRTVLFVSHNMGAIENLCNTVMVLNKGRIVNSGKTSEMINYYSGKIIDDVISKSTLDERVENRSGDGRIRFTNFCIKDTNNNLTDVIRSGTDVVFEFGFKALPNLTFQNIDVGFSISTYGGQILTVHYQSYKGDLFKNISGDGCFRFQFKKFPFTQGKYLIGARILISGQEADWPIDGVGYIDVETGDFFGTGSAGWNGPALLNVDGVWQVVAQEKIN
jgi:lipopolysaccharide transport system ATP-binding protein